MRRIILSIMMGLIATIAIAQERTVENRPYTDLRPFHFGVMVGTHLQDLEFINAGPVTYTDENGAEVNSNDIVQSERTVVVKTCLEIPVTAATGLLFVL